MNVKVNLVVFTPDFASKAVWKYGICTIEPLKIPLSALIFDDILLSIAMGSIASLSALPETTLAPLSSGGRGV